MTDREKAVVMAYTGVCMLANDKMGLFYQYVQNKLGRCVMTHELAYHEVNDAIKEASHDDFIELCESSDEPRLLTKREAYDYMREEKPCFIEVNREEAAVWLTPVNYGRGWRCWTSRPTDEQREAAKWDDV